jgi:hypothetical protein
MGLWQSITLQSQASSFEDGANRKKGMLFGGDKMAILKIRDSDGTVQEILALKGDKGDNGADGAKGADGADYVLTEADKQEIATKVVGMVSTETWTFTLEDGSTVTKTVVLK